MTAGGPGAGPELSRAGGPSRPLPRAKHPSADRSSRIGGGLSVPPEQGTEDPGRDPRRPSGGNPGTSPSGRRQGDRGRPDRSIPPAVTPWSSGLRPVGGTGNEPGPAGSSDQPRVSPLSCRHRSVQLRGGNGRHLLRGTEDLRHEGVFFALAGLLEALPDGIVVNELKSVGREEALIPVIAV